MADSLPPDMLAQIAERMGGTALHKHTFWALWGRPGVRGSVMIGSDDDLTMAMLRQCKDGARLQMWTGIDGYPRARCSIDVFGRDSVNEGGACISPLLAVARAFVQVPAVSFSQKEK